MTSNRLKFSQRIWINFNENFISKWSPIAVESRTIPGWFGFWIRRFPNWVRCSSIKTERESNRWFLNSFHSRPLMHAKWKSPIQTQRISWASLAVFSTHWMLAIITFPRTKLTLEFSLIPYHLCLGKGFDWCLHFFCLVLFWRGKLEKFSLLSGSDSMDSCGTTRPNLERNGLCREILTSSRKWIH